MHNLLEKSQAIYVPFKWKKAKQSIDCWNPHNPKQANTLYVVIGRRRDEMAFEKLKSFMS